MLDHRDFVTECGNSNIWFVINDELKTPDAGNLRGLTKKHLHIALAAAGHQSVETPIDLDQVSRASECFVTSATREVMPCRSLRLEDGSQITFPEGGGEVTRRTRRIFSGYIRSYINMHSEDRLL
jgi:branched-subunit amino acid aminotransferase/4-amino-4-deoxychorismate lyase